MQAIFNIVANNTDPATTWMPGRIEDTGGTESHQPPAGYTTELILEWPAY